MTRLHTLLGGKSPHPQTFVVGGMALAPPWGGPARGDEPGEHPRRPQRERPGRRSASAAWPTIASAHRRGPRLRRPGLRPRRPLRRRRLPRRGRARARHRQLPGLRRVPRGRHGRARLLLPRGRVMDGDLTSIEAVDQAGVAESVAHAHVRVRRDATLRHPSDGRTSPRYQGPAAPVHDARGRGPLQLGQGAALRGRPDGGRGRAARMLVAYAAGEASRAASSPGPSPTWASSRKRSSSTLGRIVARAIEAKLVVDRLDGWLAELKSNLASGDLAVADLSDWDPASWPPEAEGWSLGESARRRRRALGADPGRPDRALPGRRRQHLERLAARRPRPPRRAGGGARRDAGRRSGPPLEILRTVHSFDPCPACAVH